MTIENLPLRLYLIRHGQTDWSLSGQHTGRTDIPLTNYGEEEARALSVHLRDIPFSHVFTSPLQRAQNTCELAGLGSTAKIDSDLIEWDYGDYEGMKSIDIRKMRPDWDIFWDGCPYGEMPGEVSARVARLIDRLNRLKGNVALFSHGQIGGVFGALWIGLPLAQGRHFSLDTVSISILGHERSHPDVPVIEMWNYNSRSLPDSHAA